MITTAPKLRPIRRYLRGRDDGQARRKSAAKYHRTGSKALKQRVAAIVGTMALSLMAAGDVGAQAFYYYGPGFYGSRYYQPGLPPGRIMLILRQAGYTPVSAPVRRGPNYIVAAMGRSGHVRVVVNAFEGEIVNVRPAMAMQPYGAPPPYDPRMEPAPIPPGEVPAYGEPPPTYGPGGGYGPGARTEAPHTGSLGAPQPSQPIPNQRLATAPNAPAATVVPSARTPIPRPRPNTASNAPASAAAATSVPAASSPPVASPEAVPEAPPAPRKQATPLVPVAPLD